MREREGVPKARQLVRLELRSSQFNKRPCLNNQCCEQLRKTHDVNFRSLHVLMYTHMYIPPLRAIPTCKYTPIHMYTILIFNAKIAIYIVHNVDTLQMFISKPIGNIKLSITASYVFENHCLEIYHENLTPFLFA